MEPVPALVQPVVDAGREADHRDPRATQRVVHDGLSLTMGQVRARSIRKVFQQPEKFDHQ